MNWFIELFSSTLGKKLVMALTGLFLISFLVIHLIGNLQLLHHDGGRAFNTYAEFMGSNNKLKGKLVQRNGDTATINVNGEQLKATVRGKNVGEEVTAIIRLEKVKITDSHTENAIKLPLTTCMYLGDRWECLFGQTEGGLRAYSPFKLSPGEYYLQLDADKLWLY